MRFSQFVVFVGRRGTQCIISGQLAESCSPGLLPYGVVRLPVHFVILVYEAYIDVLKIHSAVNLLLGLH